MSDFRARLEQFLTLRGESKTSIEQLTPDASTREYFRVGWEGSTAIVCIYPEPFQAEEQSYLDVTALFLEAQLPVARILAFNEKLGAIAIEDFGDKILRDELNGSEISRRDELIDRAIDLIPRIHAATDAAYERNSIASRLKFDVEKLCWELDFFTEHYFSTLRQKPLDEMTGRALKSEFIELSKDLDSRASVLCHRDFHAANLMMDQHGELKIIDHQDARIGTASYDLVSLLLDRVLEAPPAEWLAIKRRRFLEGRELMGLPKLDDDEFASEFRLQTIQRCLKAVGTFSFQSATRGKTYFLPFIQPMLQIVSRAAANLGRFPVLLEVLTRETHQTRR
ncbi:MAG: phosphotransferase [Pyrinomonadaceae bacterium]|nr:phosphotransferase [Pyrinomonadaceae bacterium]